MEFSVMSVFLCFGLLAIAFWFLKQKYQVLNKDPVLKTLSILRNATRYHEMMTSMFSSYGNTFTLKDPVFQSMDYVVTCHPNNMEYILKTNFFNFVKGADFLDTVDIFGDGLFRTDSNYPEKWNIRRKASHSVIASKEFRTLAANVSQHQVEFALLPLLVHLAKQGLVVDLQDLFMRLTYDCSFAMVLGLNQELLHPSLPENQFAEAIDVVFQTVIYRHLVPQSVWKFMRSFKLGWERKYFHAKNTIDRIIQEMIFLRKEKPVGNNNLLSMFLMSHGGEDNAESPRDFAYNNISAVGDTIGSGLTWFFCLLSQNPKAEANILAELNQVVVERSKTTSNIKVFDIEQVKNLVYLHASIYEALRLYPPISLNHRAALKADVLPDGTKVRPGTKVILSPYALARMKREWGDDCADFRPERWIDEDGKFRHQLMSKFFTFSAGPRGCIGKDMSYVLMKLAVANMLFNFNIHVVDCKPDRLKPSLFVFLKEGMKVKLSERVAG